MTSTGKPKRGRGRPPLEGGTAVLYVRIPVPLRERLTELRGDRPEAEAVREALEAWVQRRKRQLALLRRPE